MVCSKGRLKAAPCKSRREVTDPKKQRQRGSARPIDKKDLCSWSITLVLDSTTKRWGVQSADDVSANHMQPHNHEFDPKLSAFLARRDAVPEVIRGYIRLSLAHNISPSQLLPVVIDMYKALGLEPPIFSLDDITAIGRDPEVIRQSGLGLNAAAQAIHMLLKLKADDPEWVVTIR